MNAIATPQASTLAELRDSGWKSQTVKQEIRHNFIRQLAAGEELFPGIVGYEDTVIPEINLALLSGHDMLFLGEKGQAKSRIMRMLTRFLDPWIPYIDHPDLVAPNAAHRHVIGSGDVDHAILPEEFQSPAGDLAAAEFNQPHKRQRGDRFA